MSPEEIAKVKAMSKEERRAHFTPLFRLGKITYAQYNYILDLDGWVTDLAKEFGGGVVATKEVSQITKNISSG